ncbi:3-hydroxybutyryl-CoA dehydrogenase [Alkalihalobacillus sp. MEB130]|uniref:3-hydroxybutyryl-CoA dehydrogenase n=1 Tax=Alkalihalobacillus sp. MEB130 TaxID=2976704 RepID=UPI0028DE3C13|nr:3-hydroxybutyryl-CoA dehydrogenase [Alkalihalobacillus sp. MEB130]MDT8860719.1 3-hydroxybutyryl-CoA dehydrogenase [Alkalihalobacillus sp. MEB130]
MDEQWTVSVIGAGRMGRGIAHVFAYSGYKVHLVDIKQRNEDGKQQIKKEALQEIESNMTFLSSVNVLDENQISVITDRIFFHHAEELEKAVMNADIIFEAVPEVIDVKKDAFQKVSRYANDAAILASTTSTFLVDEIAQFVERPERFLNTHWLNPAYLIPLVEVSPSEKTDEKVLQQTRELLEAVGKVPVTCAASPGFIVPRLQALTMNEAARLAEEGVASVEEIDKAARVGFGLRFAVLGLLEFVDWGGGDILYYASHYLKDSLNDDRFSPPDVISENMKSGDIGMKSGKGFYDFNEVNVTEYQKQTIVKFVDLLNHLGFIRPPATSKSII